jgi:methyl-accepting chemotaxis protein
MSLSIFRSLKLKLVVTIGAIFTITISALMVSSYINQKKTIADTAKAQLLKDYNSVVERIGQSADKAHAMAEIVAGMPPVQQAFAEKDREKLKNLTLPIYLASKKRVNISQFQFHLPPASSFLRLHRLEKYGDDLSGLRPTIVKTNQTRQPVLGLDKGRFGMGIRGLVPVLFNGNHVGSVEFGIALNDALFAPLKADYGIDASVLISNDNTLKIQAQTGGLVIDDTCKPVFSQVLATSQTGQCLIEKDGHHFMVLAGPLVDYAGQTEGVVMVKMDYTEQFHAVKRITWIYLLVGVLMVALTVGFCHWFIGNYLIRRIRHIKTVLNQASKGDLTSRIQIQANDEMGQLGGNINTFMDNVTQIIEGIQSRAGTLNTMSESLNAVSQNLLTRVQHVSDNTATIDGETRSMSENLNSAAAAVEETSTNVSLIATSAEEMSATIREIVKNTGHASGISREAVNQSETATRLIQVLGTAANDIGKVTETIEEISEQTNLLALNATIEAARAGEAGKGFAVVANEIKELARQTAGATGDIKNKIDSIRSTTEDAVKGIGSISAIIKNVNDNVADIASAMEQQAKTTDEISNSVVQASQGIQEVTENVSKNSMAASTIADNMSTLNQATGEISSESKQVSTSAEKSVQMAQSMLGTVEGYRIHS